jgi:hypothetical protein
MSYFLTSPVIGAQYEEVIYINFVWLYSKHSKQVPISPLAQTLQAHQFRLLSLVYSVTIKILIWKIITNSLEQNPFWETNSHSLSQVLHLLWIQTFQYHVHKSPSYCLLLYYVNKKIFSNISYNKCIYWWRSEYYYE